MAKHEGKATVRMSVIRTGPVRHQNRRARGRRAPDVVLEPPDEGVILADYSYAGRHRRRLPP